MFRVASDSVHAQMVYDQLTGTFMLHDISIQLTYMIYIILMPHT